MPIAADHDIKKAVIQTMIITITFMMIICIAT